MEVRTPAKYLFFKNNGFTEDRFGYYKGDFSLMKTTLGIFLEIVYKGEIIKKITAVEEEIKQSYEELTSTPLKE